MIEERGPFPNPDGETFEFTGLVGSLYGTWRGHYQNGRRVIEHVVKIDHINLSAMADLNARLGTLKRID